MGDDKNDSFSRLATSPRTLLITMEMKEKEVMLHGRRRHYRWN